MDDSQNPHNRWAVIVGVNKYHPEYSSEELQMAVNDAKKLRDTLRDHGYRNNHVKLLTDDDGASPNRSNIITSLRKCAEQAQPGDLLLFYFSGHGRADPKDTYLVTNDTQRDSLTDTALKLSEVIAKMKESRAIQRVIILDACQSGADLGSKGDELTTEDFIRLVHVEAEGLAILASCKKNEKSYEWLEGSRSHGVFTYFLLNALSGKADLGRKGFVTVSDVHNYVTAEVRKWSEEDMRSQTPTLKLEGAGDLILVDFRYGKPKDSFTFTKVVLGLSGEVTEQSTERARQFVEPICEGVWLEMVEIKDGRYLIGTPPDIAEGDADERPQRRTTVSYFYLGKYPVTQAQWREVAGWEKVEIDLPVDPSYFPGAHRPVESVSWTHAVEFCARLSRKTGRLYRLPTEAEWEFACRGWETTTYGIGQSVTPDHVNCTAPPGADYQGSPARSETSPVGSYKVANNFGLFDMHGNVWEWCHDWYEPYEQTEQTDPTGPETGEHRVARGGSWREYAARCRSACRNHLPPEHTADDLGFRVALIME